MAVRYFVSPCRPMLPGEGWLWLLSQAEVAMGHLCPSAPLPLDAPAQAARRCAVGHLVAFGDVSDECLDHRTEAQSGASERVNLKLLMAAGEGLVRHLGVVARRSPGSRSLCRRWVLELANYFGEAGNFHAGVELLRGFIPDADRHSIGDEEGLDAAWSVAPELQLDDAAEDAEVSLVILLAKVSEMVTAMSYTSTFIPKQDYESGLAAVYGVEAVRRARLLGPDHDGALSAALGAAGASLALSAQATAYRRLHRAWHARLPNAAKQFSDAKDALEECVEVRHRLHDPDIARAVHSLGELCFCAATANLIGMSCFKGAPSAALAAAAVRNLREAVAIYEADGRIMTVGYADLLKDLGKVLLYLGSCEEGGLVLARSYRLHCALCGPAHPRSHNVLTLLTAAGEEEQEEERGGDPLDTDSSNSSGSED